MCSMSHCPLHGRNCDECLNNEDQWGKQANVAKKIDKTPKQRGRLTRRKVKA